MARRQLFVEEKEPNDLEAEPPEPAADLAVACFRGNFLPKADALVRSEIVSFAGRCGPNGAIA
jgi:hypothetical protein